jgi:predicted PolB exonuclease-like 3'-5' exonuclease
MALPYPEAQRQPPANYKSEEAISRWREADRAAWETERVKAYSLNPRLGRVLCVGLTPAVGGDDVQVMEAWNESEERFAVWRTFELLALREGEVVTWNGHFDLRFLLVRGLILGVELPKRLLYTNRVQGWFKRYTLYPHFDCKAALMNHEVRVSGEGLDEWAQALGVAGKTPGMDGGAVWPLYNAGQFEAIAEYCRQDVRTTRDIFRRIAPTFSSWGVPHVLEAGL